MDKNEAQTRREIIDLNLRKAGWEINDPSQVSLEFDIYLGKGTVEEEFRTEFTDHQFVDYLLLGKDGKPLAVVEAKRTSKDAQVGKEQALQYSKNIEEKLGMDRPFVFYTNGYETFFWDSENYPPRRIFGFPTRDDLERLRFLRKERTPLSVELISPDIAGRAYQIQAVRTVLEGIEAHKRKFLLVMATGTGKTRMCLSLVDVLTRARWGQRVLFLVDRIALGDQALDAFEVLDVQSKFQLEGIKADNLPYEIQSKLIEEGKNIEEINFEGTDLERKVTNSGTNSVIVREFMEESIKDKDGVLPGKSIIFAVSKAHARRLEEIFDILYPEHKGKLANVIVSDDPRAYGKGGLMDQFKNQEFPRVAISVDMLDTGIDVREIVNLVFAKPVYSYTKFWQMIGRGTRVLEEDPAKRKPWCTEKDKFLIIDCWSNFQYFKMHPKGREPGSQTPLPVRLFHARLTKLEAALKTNRKEVADKVIEDLQSDIEALPDNNVVVLENKAVLEQVNEVGFWTNITDDKLDYLRKTIAPILRARHGMDFNAMRFEVDITDISTANILANTEASDVLKESIVEQVSQLPLSINTVAKEKEFIEEIQGNKFWLSLAEDKLYEAVKRLGPLMRFRDPLRPKIEKLHLEDIITKKEWIEFGPEHERLTTFAYRERVEKLIKSLKEENSTLQKIASGEEVDEWEIRELEALLQKQDPFVTEKLLQKD